MSPDDFRLRVFVAGDEVRTIAIRAIATAAMASPDPAHPTLHRVVITTRAPAESVFFFRDEDLALQAVANILAGRDRTEQVRLSLSPDINQHLLHPNRRN